MMETRDAALTEKADSQGQSVIVVSEYGITKVTDAVHINRELRNDGLINVRVEEYGHRQLDAGASPAFALADHQLAHVYVNDLSRLAKTKQLLQQLDGVEHALDDEGENAWGRDHPRSGELIAISNADRWFSFYYWLDIAVAPDRA